MKVFIIILIILIVYIVFENKNLKVSHWLMEHSGLPEIPEDIKIAFLTDLHNNSFGRDNKKLLQRINEYNPEYVVLTGDMITSKKRGKYKNALALLLELAKQYPVYYSLGNHESRLCLREPADEGFQAYCEKLKGAGVIFLDNSCAEIKKGECSIFFYGLTLPLEYYGKYKTTPHPSADELTLLLGKPKKDGYHILLAHMPVYFEEYVQWGADLVLSGHIHGGIMILPHLGGVISPQYQWFPKYDFGKFLFEQSVMLISRGLGVHSIPLRIFNSPELLYITLKQDKRNKER